MKRIATILCILITTQGLHGQASRPVPQVKKILIISVDGLRPDVLLRANAPRMRQLMERGTFTLWARSTPGSVTLPTHVSMLTGVTPEVHGIMWNSDLPLAENVYPNAPTLFELAKQNGYTTAMAVAKDKLEVLCKPDTIDWVYLCKLKKGSQDPDVAAHASVILREHQPDVMFVHFALVDVVGHASGWGTPAQLEAAAQVDSCIGTLLDTIDSLKLMDQTVVMLTADHGGQGRVHGPEEVRSRTIPWIVAGPGIRQGLDLTRHAELNVEVYDTFSTACALMGIPVRKKVTGKFVGEILEKQELLMPDSPPTYAPATQPAVRATP